MNEAFTYVILQYSHSVLTREAINIGLLFRFQNESQIHIHLKATGFLKHVYKTFDQPILDLALQFIYENVSHYNCDPDENQVRLDQELTRFLRDTLKWQDSLLQFTDPFTSLVIRDNQSTIDYYRTLLLDH